MIFMNDKNLSLTDLESKIIDIGYFKKNSPQEEWPQRFEYDYSYRFMKKKGKKEVWQRKKMKYLYLNY